MGQDTKPWEKTAAWKKWKQEQDALAANSDPTGGAAQIPTNAEHNYSQTDYVAAEKAAGLRQRQGLPAPAANSDPTGGAARIQTNAENNYSQTDYVDAARQQQGPPAPAGFAPSSMGSAFFALYGGARRQGSWFCRRYPRGYLYAEDERMGKRTPEGRVGRS